MAERRRAAREARKPAARPTRLAPFQGWRSFCQQKMSEYPEIFQHLENSRIEFWKAIRSLIDWRISSLEQRREGIGKRPVTKVKITE